MTYGGEGRGMVVGPLQVGGGGSEFGAKRRTSDHRPITTSALDFEMMAAGITSCFYRIYSLHPLLRLDFDYDYADESNGERVEHDELPPPPRACGGQNTSNGGQNSTTAAQNYPTLNPSPGAKWIKRLTQDRLGQFNGGHFGDVNLGAALFVRKESGEVACAAESRRLWSAPGLTKPTFAEAMKQEFRPASKGEQFGPSWTNHWWKVTLHIPEEWEEYERVQFEFDPGCEAMIMDTDGTPLQGITGGFGGDRRVEYIIPAAARKKGVHEIVIESSCNGMFGMAGGGIGPPDPNRYFQLAMADLVVPNQDAWRLLWDFTTLRELVDVLPGGTPVFSSLDDFAAGTHTRYSRRVSDILILRILYVLYTSTTPKKALATANAIMNTFDHKDLWSAPGLTKPTFAEALEQEFRPAQKGEQFGPSWRRTDEPLVEGALHIPEDWEEYERVQFEFDPGCEAMIMDADGTPLQGITGGAHVRHGRRGIGPPDLNRYFQLAMADLVVPNQLAWRLLWDFTTLRAGGCAAGGRRSDADIHLRNFYILYTSTYNFVRKESGEGWVDLRVWSAPGLTKPTFAEALEQEFRPAQKGEQFGPSWTNHWWKVTLHIPEDWEEYERVQFEFDPGCEAMIMDADGTPLQGITGGAACSAWPAGASARQNLNRYFQLAMADLVVPNQLAWRLLWDFTTLRELVDVLPGGRRSDADIHLRNFYILYTSTVPNSKTRPSPPPMRS
ncbi:hypothetical protein C8R43DRAFT_966256 [Mycena crocata]|nr:hypothetical protein C8R43DRAFT_966256 [Mycena crocata]